MNGKYKIIVVLIIVSVLGAGWVYYSKREKAFLGKTNLVENIIDPVVAEKIRKENEEYQMMRNNFLSREFTKCEKKVQAKELELDDCYYNAANLAQDISLCGKIQDEEKKNHCKAMFTLANLDSAKLKLQDCLALPIDLKEPCVNSFISNLNEIDECRVFQGEQKSFCLDQVNTKLALVDGDKTFCEKIANSVLNKSCVTQIASRPMDTDNDGITDEMEMSYKLDPFNKDTDRDKLSDGEELNKYKTNPLNPDSDNDGFKDGEEVANGFNPNGR